MCKIYRLFQPIRSTCLFMQVFLLGNMLSVALYKKTAHLRHTNREPAQFISQEKVILSSFSRNEKHDSIIFQHLTETETAVCF